MEITVSFKVNIDPAAWTLNYGVEGKKEIREDVRRYCENGCRDTLRDVGVLLDD